MLIAYNKWATDQSTGKKAPYWAFYDELKTAVGKYPPVWRCVGCHPVAAAALALYDPKKEPWSFPIWLVSFCMHPCTFLVCGADFCMHVRTHTRTHAQMHA